MSAFLPKSTVRFANNSLLVVSVLLAALPALAQTWVSDLVVVPMENDPVIGTALYRLAKLSPTGQAVMLAQRDNSGLVGIVQQGAGTSGKAGIAQMGVALCEFDGATTSGDYVLASEANPGLCHDAGAQFPGTGSIVGRAISTNAGAGVFEILVFPAESRGITRSGASPGTASAKAESAGVSPMVMAPGVSAGGTTNSVQYNSGSGFAGILNSSGDKQFLTQTSGHAPAFSGIALGDLPAISSTDLSDSATLIRGNQVTLPGTTPSTFAPVPPGATLVAYGDSITAGKGSSTKASAYPAIIASTKGWILKDYAIGGDGLFDQLSEHLWGSTIDASSLSLLMIGANDDGYVYHQSAVWDPALQAAYLWLLTPQKEMGNILAQKGTWTKDAVLSSGIFTTENKATATGTTFGNVVYVVARSTPTNSPTFTITVDNTVYGPFTTPTPWMTMRKHNLAPYSVRIGNLATTYHRVIVQNQGTGELHVDFIAGNKGQLTATGPYLYASTIYKVDTAWEFTMQFLNNQIRSIASQLAADGLGIVLADVEGDCANPRMVDGKMPGGSNCSQSDGVHPNDAGHRIIANAFLRMMPNSDSSASGSYPTSPNFASVTATTANLNAVNTSAISSSNWLSLKSAGTCYWMISGPGDFVSNQSGGCSIGTDRSGALLPPPRGAPRSIRATNVIAGGYAAENISGSPDLAMDRNTIVWTLVGNASPRITIPAGNGARFTVLICQDKVGGRSFTWPASVKNGTTPGTTPNRCTVQDFVQTGLGSGELVGVSSAVSFQP
jgi:lysophospholipase L1-like esterase